MKVLFQRKPLPENFSRNVDCNFDNPGEELAETLKRLTKSRKPFLKKLFVQKNDFPSRKTIRRELLLFDKNSGNTHKNSGKKFSLRIPKHSYKNWFFFGNVFFPQKKIFSTTRVQVWQPWRKISTEWPQVLLTESKTFCKIKRSFRDFFSRKCSTGSIECSLNNPVASFLARRPILFGSESHIHFKKQISERKLLPKYSTGHQNLKCSQSWKTFITKTDKKIVEPVSPKKNFSPKIFFFVMENGKWQTCRKNTSSVQKHFSQCLAKNVRLIFFENKTFFAKIASCLVERSFSNPVADFPPNDDVFNKTIFLSNYKFPPKSFSEHVRFNFVNRGEKTSPNLQI